MKRPHGALAEEQRSRRRIARALREVVAVADVYEALTAARPYRAAMFPEEALRVIDRSTGDHLAAEAVTALRDVH